MPLTNCSHCDAVLTHQGVLRGVCWSCGKPLFRAVQPGEPILSQPAEAAEPAEPLPIEQVLRWGTVRTALALIPTGLLLAGGSVLLVVILTAGSSGLERSAQNGVLTICLGSVVVVGVVLTLTGHCMCSVTPWASGAAGWAIASVVCLATGALLLVIYLLAEAENRDVTRRKEQAQWRVSTVSEGGAHQVKEEPLRWTPGALSAFTYIVLGTLMVAGNTFTVFLYTLANHFRSSGLAASLLAYLIVSVLIGFADLGAALLIDESKLTVAAGMWIALGVLLAPWFVIQVFLVRRLITRALLK
jgi:hypothetical protein